MDGMGWEMEPFMQLHLRELSASDVPTARYLHHLPTCETLALTFHPSAGQETLTLISTKPTLFCRNPLRFHGST